MSGALSGLHFFTHIGLSWLVASLWPGSRRDRWLVVAAGVLPDLDGAGIVWSEHAYLAAHRAVGHGLLFALLLLAVAALRADAPWPAATLALASFHLHLLLDVVGTGGLPVRYFWPLSDRGWTYDGHWALASWPNAVVMALTLIAVLAVAWRRRRAPGV